MGRDTFHQTKLLKAPFNLALNTAREGAATASLGNLGQCLTSSVHYPVLSLLQYFHSTSAVNQEFFNLIMP